MTCASDAAEPAHLTAEIPWMEQVRLHMKAHGITALNSGDKFRLHVCQESEMSPWDAFVLVVGDNVQF